MHHNKTVIMRDKRKIRKFTKNCKLMYLSNDLRQDIYPDYEVFDYVSLAADEYFLEDMDELHVPLEVYVRVKAYHYKINNNPKA